jgi:hypothetical protein
MRTNLLQMLDELGVPRRLGLDSASDLFGCGWDLIHTTSILRYPVFLGDMERNYTGHNPRLATSAFLRAWLQEWFVPEILQMPQALLIPLGHAVSDALEELVRREYVARKRCLLGFPHPSGAHGHRQAHFAQPLSICTARSLTISNRAGLPSNPCKRPRGRGAPRLLAGAKLLVAKQWKRRFVRQHDRLQLMRMSFRQCRH